MDLLGFEVRKLHSPVRHADGGQNPGWRLRILKTTATE